MEINTSSLTDLAAIAQTLRIPEKGVRATVELLDEGNTVPFITRYRKEQTGGLDEEQIRQIQDAVHSQRQLNERKQKILKSIQSQGKLTDSLKEQILAAATTKTLEDLYLPFKPRKQSLANVARQRGLEPVAQNVIAADPIAANLDQYFDQFVNEENGLPTRRDVEAGVQHLIAEYFAEKVELRDLVRRHMWTGKICSKKIESSEDTPAETSDQQQQTSPRSEETQAEKKTQPEANGKPLSAASHEPPVPQASNEPQSPSESGTSDQEPHEAAAASGQFPSSTAAASPTAGQNTADTQQAPTEDGASAPDLDAAAESSSVGESDSSGDAATSDAESKSKSDTADDSTADGVGQAAVSGDATQEMQSPEAGIDPPIRQADADQPAAADGATGQMTADVPPPTDSTGTPSSEATSGATGGSSNSGDLANASPEPSAEITMVKKAVKAVTTTTETITSADDGAKSKKSGKTVAQTKAELTKQRREMRREARHRKRQKLEQSFKDYFDFTEPLKKLPHHRILALNRGDRSKVLRVRIEFDSDKLKSEAEEKFIQADHPHHGFLKQCLADALSRLVAPSIDREIRRELTEKAERHAVRVFAQNLRKLLLQPPLRGRRVLAIDPGFKSGCKLVALDEFGNVLDHSLVHVIGSAQRVEESRKKLAEQIKKHDISVVAIGNGTACRETEQMVAQAIDELVTDRDVGYLIVNEAGASVYSTSPLGREELPKFDATVRGAVSIGRRTLDPLSELVKIDPANIGVGLYQHDVKAKHLRESLDAVVESCVNYVGVDVNSASPALLGYVSGLNQLTARRVYEYRLKHGPFRKREELKNVPGVGEATFVQAAGFLKVTGGDNPLDRTWIHPESYEIAEKVLNAIGCDLSDLVPQSRSTAEDSDAEQTSQDAGRDPTLTVATVEAADSTNQTTDQDGTASSTPDVKTTETPDPSVGSTSAGEDTEVSSSVDDVKRAPDESSPSATATDTNGETATPSEGLDVKSAAETVETAPADPSTESQPVDSSAAPSAAAPSPAAASPAAATVDQQTSEDEKKSSSPAISKRLSDCLKSLDIQQLAEQLGVGQILLRDIVSSLERPGLDPRDELPAPVFRRGVMKLEDLTPGMELTGTVLNVVDFGAFVDIGLSDSGLVHVSRLSPKFVSDPHEVVSVGDVLNVWVVDVDTKRRRVSLTAIRPGTEPERPVKKRSSAPSVRKERPKGRGPSRRDRSAKGKQKSGWKPKAKPKPVVPITDAMAEGKEPMRTFSDLRQFYQRKKTKGSNGKD